jgi:hypothetical protein
LTWINIGHGQRLNDNSERVFETVLPVFDPLDLAPASRRGFFLGADRF